MSTEIEILKARIAELEKDLVKYKNAYDDSHCSKCECELEETRKGTNYWECAGGCGKRTCDDCVDQDHDVDQDDDEGDGYGCETCRSDGTMSASKK